MQTLLWMVLAIFLTTSFHAGNVRPDGEMRAQSEPPQAEAIQNSEVEGQDALKRDYNIKVDVDLVTVDVTLYGSPVRDLRAEDFVVFDNEKAQRITQFSRDQIPLAVALVVDDSQSLAYYISELQSAARSALSSLKPEDQVVLFGFSLLPSRLSDLTQDPSQIVQKLTGLKSAGSTNIWDAIYASAHFLRERAPDHRRAVILISDNGQLIGWGQTGNSALQESLITGTALYAIRIPGSASLYAESETVRGIAEDSGGEFLDVGSGRTLTEALHQSVTNLRTQYTLGFVPADTRKDGAFHRLRVALKADDACPGCRIRTRKGYYAGSVAGSLPGGNDFRVVPPATRVASPVYNRITFAAADMAETNEISFNASAMLDKHSISGRMETKVDLQIDPSKIAFKANGALHTAALCVAVFAASADGVYVSSAWKNTELRLWGDTFQRTLHSDIFVSISVRGSARFVTVVVYDLNSDRMGSRRVVPER